jgi:AraC-like DNA-binding protein
MNMASMIAGSGALLGLILSVALLWSRGGNRFANRILAALMAALTAYLISLVFIHNQWATQSNLVLLGLCMLFLNGPLLYGYVRAMASQMNRLRPADSIHLLPFLLVLIYELFLQSGQVDIAERMRQARGGWPPTVLSALAIVYYALLMSYCLASVRLLRRHQNMVMHQFSNLRGINLRWLRTLCVLCAGIALLGLAIALLRLSGSFDLWPRGIYSMLLMLVVFYTIAFMAVAQPMIFVQPPDGPGAAGVDGQGNRVVEPETGGSDTDRDQSVAQYRTSSLTRQQAELCWQQLQDYLAVHKPYVQNELRIADLAEMLDMPVSHLSQAINQVAQLSFYSLINAYRVRAAQDLLAGTSLPASSIAQEAGFNSESTFYKHFKQATGMTPRQYRQAHGSPPTA